MHPYSPSPDFLVALVVEAVAALAFVLPLWFA